MVGLLWLVNSGATTPESVTKTHQSPALNRLVFFPEQYIVCTIDINRHKGSRIRYENF